MAAENIALLSSDSSIRSSLISSEKYESLFFLLDRCDSLDIKGDFFDFFYNLY